MNYWTRTLRRAWREVLAEFKSNLRLAGAMILTPALTAFAAALVLSNHWLVSILIALAALALAAAAPLIVRALALPARAEIEQARQAQLTERELKEEIELLEQVLKTFTPLNGDTTLIAGLAYCQYRDWTIAGPGPTPGDIRALLPQIQQLGHEERLHLWGRATPAGHHLPIPPVYWERGRIDPNPSQTAKGRIFHTRRDDALHPRRLYDLRINRAEFEREWPAD